MSDLEIGATDQEWEEYKSKFQKVYDGEEDKLRRSIYVESKKKIAEHNKKYEAGEVTWTMGINQFADKKSDESVCGCMGLKKKGDNKNCEK